MMSRLPRRLRLTAASIAPHIDAPRELFARCFDGYVGQVRNVRRFAVIARQRQRKEPISPGPNQDKADFRAALDEAEQKGFLQEFMEAYGDQLILTTREPDENTARIRLSLVARDRRSQDTITATYQAIVNTSKVLLPGAVSAGLLQSVHRTCRLVVKSDQGQETGTGFLIGPRLVLTCWHVIRSLVRQKSSATVLQDDPGEPIEGSHSRIKVEFDVSARADQIGPTWSCGVAFDWLVAGSRSAKQEHQYEADRRMAWPQEAKDFETFLDFAVIELDTPAGFDRGYFDLTASPPNLPQGNLVILHHPGQFAMRLSTGTFDVQDNVKNAFSTVAFSTNRNLHTANTIGGSSGGLCLGYDMLPVAMHQAALHFTSDSDLHDSNRQALRSSAINVAVPLAKIVSRAGDAIAARIGNLKTLKCKLANGRALIGRTLLQEAIAAAIDDKSRIIVVQIDYQGQQPLRQVGKTFSSEVLTDSLLGALHEVVRLSAADLRDDAHSTAAAILNFVQKGLSAKLTKNQQLIKDAQSTEVNDSIVRLAKEVADLLSTHATRRTLWIIIDELDIHPLSDTSTRVFFEKLYPEIASRKELRLVLIGMTDPDMPALNIVGPRSVDALKSHLKVEDVKQWLARRLGYAADDTVLSSMAKIAETLALREKELSRSAAFSRVINEVFEPSLPVQ